MTGRPLPCQPVAGRGRSAHVVGMAEKDKNRDREREERLAAALRENLKRRKARARRLSGTAPDDGQP